MIFHSIKEKFVFFVIPTILFLLIPFFLITGPLLSDLSVSIISILFLTYCIKEKNFSYFNNKFFFFFLFFWFYLIFNSLVNNFNFGSFKISFFYFRYGIFIIAVTAFLKEDHKIINYFFYCIFLCFTFLIFDGLIQYFTGENILGWKNSDRTSSFFGDEEILGSYLSRLWPIFFGLSIFALNKKNKLFYIIILIFILSEVLIFLSGDRTAFFYINLSAIFIILFSKNLFKVRLYTSLLAILLILIISLINPTAKERVFDQTLQEMNLLNSKNKKDDQIYIFTKQHNTYYLTAYKMFLDNKLFGVGVKNYRNNCNNEKYASGKFPCSTHPHNTYIQILAETGIVGLLFLIFILLYFSKYILKHLMYRLRGKLYFSDFEICLLSGVAIYIWPFVPTGNFFNNWLSILLILYLPFLIWSKTLVKLK